MAMTMVNDYTSKKATQYLKDLLAEIKERKIEVHTADRRVSNNSLGNLPSGSVTIDFIVLPRCK